MLITKHSVVSRIFAQLFHVLGIACFMREKLLFLVLTIILVYAIPKSLHVKSPCIK